MSTTDSESPNADAFEAWLGERHKWLQTAATRLIEAKRHPTPEELTELARLCVAEATKEADVEFSSVVPGSLAQASNRPALRLTAISEARGINAIKHDAGLSFGKSPITVIYGANGSGKTGFSRAIKHAAGARFKGDIHPNVFNAGSPPPSAKFHFTVDGVESQPSQWTLADGHVANLRDIQVFDTNAATIYLTAENEASYEPSSMRFVSSLIKISDRVTEFLAQTKANMACTLPGLPPAWSETDAGKWLRSLKHNTSIEVIDTKCAYTEQLNNEKIAAESAIAQKDVAARLLAIVVERNLIQITKNKLAAIKENTSPESLEALFASKSDTAAKRKIANECAEKAFGSAPLQGVGQESWQALWTQARLYSQDHAYSGKAFPHVGDEALCVLCQQALDPTAKARLIDFEAFVTGGLESAAKTAETTYSALVSKIPACPGEEDWLVTVGSLKLEHEVAVAHLAQLSERITSIANANDLSTIPLFDWSPLQAAVETASTALNTEEQSLKTVQQEETRKLFEARIVELSAMQWLSHNVQAIKSEVTRLRGVEVLTLAARLANTSPLTKKNNELASAELAAGYQKRFKAELERLGGKRLPVQPVSKEHGKGKVTFGLSLVGSHKAIAAEKILSEGENRVIALAAFLADITGSGQKSPFVFDDPISSLDQDFEERVVERLIELSKDRQVIVFTHRLSILVLLESACGKIKAQAELEKVEPWCTIHIESLCRMGPNAGLVQPLGLKDGSPKTSINSLRDHILPKIVLLQQGDDPDAYAVKMQSACTDFRIVVEKCVETILLNGVLLRFRRALNTQGKIGKLAKISSSDCAFIDDLMTRYSVFEHSQAGELPAKAPDLDQFGTDVKAVAAWIAEFEARAVPPITEPA